ncbi:MAG: hypothetical protein V3W20_00220 [Candidatus Neomarinimicrobiota bacterium]
MILYKRNNQLCYEDINGTGEIRCVPDAQAEFDNNSADGQITISIFRYQDRGHKNFFNETFDYDQVLDADSIAYGDSFNDVINGFDSGLDVNIQDQTTDPIIVKFNQLEESTTLSSAASIDDMTITLTDATGTADGKYIILFDPNSVRFTTFIQIGAAAGNVITLDCPIDFDYPAGTFVDITETNMNVNGSVTTQTFGLRGAGAPLPGVELDFDLTRIIISCETTDAVDLSKFGDIIGGLTNGICCRRRDGKFQNVFNVKTNKDIAGIMFDWVVFDAQNLQQGQHGFIGRLTFAGQNKLGVTIRLKIGEDLEFLIQDNLSTLLTLEVIAEGHIVQP